MSQISFFDGSQPLKITKPIRLIELFAGVGAQAKALERLGVDFEHYRVCEFDKYAVTSYNAIHGTNFAPSDITTLRGKDLGICDVDRFTYILTFISLPRFVFSRKATRNARRQPNPIIFAVGSQETVGRN